jgi:hypothetical protein
MRNFVLQAITTSYKRMMYSVCLCTQISQFKKIEEAHVVQIACYNIVTIGIDIFQFYVRIFSNLKILSPI